jgi:hypothetical protein
VPVKVPGTVVMMLRPTPHLHLPWIVVRDSRQSHDRRTRRLDLGAVARSAVSIGAASLVAAVRGRCARREPLERDIAEPSRCRGADPWYGHPGREIASLSPGCYRPPPSGGGGR